MGGRPRVAAFALAGLGLASAAVGAAGQNRSDRFAGVELTIVPVAAQVHRGTLDEVPAVETTAACGARWGQRGSLFVR